jgi:hypothetical protein
MLHLRIMELEIKWGMHLTGNFSCAETRDWTVLKIATNERDLLNAKTGCKTSKVGKGIPVTGRGDP